MDSASILRDPHSLRASQNISLPVYIYDDKKRVTEVRNGVGGPARYKYYYETNPFAMGFSQYTTGRLAAVEYTIDTETPSEFGPIKLTVREMYSYTQWGVLEKKRMRIERAGLTSELDLVYTFDAEGRVLTVQAPQQPLRTHYYDPMGRPQRLTESGADLVSNIAYNAAGQMTEFGTAAQSWYERRQYNGLGQLTRITAGPTGAPQMDQEYVYSATQNNGQITSMYDWKAGGPINYSYDALGRLATAGTTLWGLAFTYDGFGNRTNQQVTAGTAPALALSYDANTNRINTPGYGYDANGNLTLIPWSSTSRTMTYDIDNRLVRNVRNGMIGGIDERYGYAPDGKRVYRQKVGSLEETIYFWAGNEMLGTFNMFESGGVLYLQAATTQKYFAGRKVGVTDDRVGSNATNNAKYFPYGEERTPTTGDGNKFATYWRHESTGLHYADQRWYSPLIGRFLTADPYEASGGARNPALNENVRSGHITPLSGQ